MVCYSKRLSAVSFRCFHKVIHFVYCITKRCFAMGVEFLITMTFRNRRPDIMHIQTVVGIVFCHIALLSLIFILYHILPCWSIARLGMAFPSAAIGQLLVTPAEVAAMKSFGRRRASLAHCDAFWNCCYAIRLLVFYAWTALKNCCYKRAAPALKACAFWSVLFL